MKWVVVLPVLMLGAVHAQAELESTTVLPKGIWSSKFIFGTYSGLEDRYNSNGLVEGVADQYHLNLSGSSLSKMNPDANRLVQILNNLSPNEKLGSELSLGTLTFKSSPSVQYFAPTLAYGVTQNFSIGLGIPLVHFHNSMQVSSDGNAAAIAKYVKNTNPDLDSAVAQLVAASSNMSNSINSVLAARGYKPLRDVDFMAAGDLQVSGIYKYYSDDYWRLALRPFVQFPTGRQDDPDDLVDTAIGGQPAVGTYSVHEFVATGWLTLATSIGYQANIQDSVSKRVPNGGDDILPAQDRKDTVRRKTGNSIFLEAGPIFTISRPLMIRTVYELIEKDPDWYDGDRGWNYSLLAQDTGSQQNEFKAMLEFSTIDMYQSKRFSVPFIFGYVYGNTFYAVNAANEISNQVYLRMFF